jgi:outer membrane protein
MNVKKLAIAVLVGCAATAAQGEDLIDVFQLALDNDPQLRAADASRLSVAENKRQAFANFLPNVTGSLSYSETSGDFALAGGIKGDIDSSRDNYQVTLNQSIYRHDNYTRLDAARNQGLQAQADYDASFDDLLLRTVDRYFAVLTAIDGLSFSEAEEKANARQLEQAEQRYEVGLTAITDVHEARASYDRSRANVIVARNTLDDAKEALAELTGRYIDDVDELMENYPLIPPDPADVQAWVDTALESNPTLQTRKFAAEAAHDNVRTQRAAHYPTLGAQVNHSDSTNGGDLGAFSTETTATTTIGIQLNVPIYEGGAASSRTRQAAYDYDAAIERLEQQPRATVRQTRNDYRAVIAGISQVEAFKQAVVSSRSALEATEAGFEVGTRTIVDVLIAQRQLFQSQSDYSRARHDLIVNHVRLQTSAGTIEMSHLDRVNSALE